jgi:hypothetical protein
MQKTVNELAPDSLSSSYFTGTLPTGISMMTCRSEGGFGPAPTFIRPSQSTTPPPALPQDPGDPILELLAQESGGQSEIFEMHSAGVVEQMIAFVEDIAAELRGQYTIGYYPAKGGDINKHALRLRTVSSQYHARIHRELLRP